MRYGSRPVTDWLYANFDERYYLYTNMDLMPLAEAPIQHFLRVGWKKSRNPSEKIDLKQLPNYHALVSEGNLETFLEHIILFQEKLATSESNQRIHRVTKLDIYKSRIFFDDNFYRRKNPDLKLLRGTEAEHFCVIGWKERRSPSKLFDVRFYLDRYGDVSKAGVNPVVHYVDFGWREGRVTRPDMLKYEFARIG